MSVYETWLCDVCLEASIGEDDGREQGWVVLQRRQWRETVFPAMPPLIRDGVPVSKGLDELRLPPRWHEDTTHICPDCLEDERVVAHHLDWHAEYSEVEENWHAARERHGLLPPD